MKYHWIDLVSLPTFHIKTTCTCFFNQFSLHTEFATCFADFGNFCVFGEAKFPVKYSIVFFFLKMSLFCYKVAVLLCGFVKSWLSFIVFSMQFDHHIGVQFVKEAFEDNEEVGVFSLGWWKWVLSKTCGLDFVCHTHVPLFLHVFRRKRRKRRRW